MKADTGSMPSRVMSVLNASSRPCAEICVLSLASNEPTSNIKRHAFTMPV